MNRFPPLPPRGKRRECRTGTLPGSPRRAAPCGENIMSCFNPSPHPRLTPQPPDRRRADDPSLTGCCEKGFYRLRRFVSRYFSLKGEVSNHRGIFDERRSHDLRPSFHRHSGRNIRYIKPECLAAVHQTCPHSVFHHRLRCFVLHIFACGEGDARGDRVCHLVRRWALYSFRW